MSNNNEYRWIRNTILSGVLLISVIWALIGDFFVSEETKNHPLYYLKYRSNYVGMWQNINKEMSDDTLYLHQCGIRFCYITFYDHGKIHEKVKFHAYHLKMEKNFSHRAVVENRYKSAIKNTNIHFTDIYERFVLSDNEKTLTSVIGYYDKQRKEWVQLGETYTYHKISE